MCSGTKNANRNRFEQVVVSFELLPDDKDILTSPGPKSRQMKKRTKSKGKNSGAFDSISEIAPVLDATAR